MEFVRILFARTTRCHRASALGQLAGRGPFLLLALLAALPSPASAADPLSRLMKGPVIRFEQRTVDFGRIPQHVSRAQTFTFRNDGTEPLLILKVTPDCGCTLAEPADTVIAPGATTTLRVVFNSGEYDGDQRKVVILETNDPAEPRIDLLLLAHVAPDVEVSERILDFGPVRRGGTPVLTTIVKAESDVPFTVRTPVGAEELVQWTVAQSPQTGPGAWKVEARVRPDAPFGRFNVRVEIPYDHPKVKSDHISVRGFIHAYFSPADVAIRDVTTVSEALDAAVERYPSLVVLADAERSAAKRGTAGVKKAREALFMLGEISERYAAGELEQGLDLALAALPDFKPDISDTAKRQYQRHYVKTLGNGKKVRLGPHFDIGGEDGRAYLYVDKDQKRIVLGHCGEHLPGKRDS